MSVSPCWPGNGSIRRWGGSSAQPACTSARDTYLAAFAGRHDWTVRGHHLKVGAVVHSDDIVGRKSFLQTPFYQHFVGPWGFEVALIGMLDLQRRDHMAICCPGPPGIDPGDLRSAIVRLTPHFQRAARISRRIGEADLRSATAATMLDNSPYCVIALGPDLDILPTNAAADALLDGSADISRHQSRLRIDNFKILAELQQLARGELPLRSLTFMLDDPAGGQFMMQALCVDETQSDHFANRAGGTAVMLVGGQRLLVTENFVISSQQAFDLTAAEARLAAFLVEGSGVDGYARTRGVTHNAGKYLLKGLYAKTGLSNQTELIALLRDLPLG